MQNNSELPFNKTVMTVKEGMEQYDNYPAYLRKFLRELPYNLVFPLGSHPEVYPIHYYEKYVNILRQNAILKSYGPNHPELRE